MAAAAEGEEGPSPGAAPPLPPPPSSPPQQGLHRLLLRVQCVELAGAGSGSGGGGEGGPEERGAEEDGAALGAGAASASGSSMLSPRQHRRRALLGEGVCEVVALVDTTARAICRGLVEAAMPAARAEAVERFALVMVHPTQEADGSLTHILHTLLAEERPIALVEAVLAQCRGRGGSSGSSSGSSNGGVVLGFTEEQLLEENLITWFLKDLGGAPLDFRGYVSGAEASEDEAEAGAGAGGDGDLAQQMGQGYYSGYLLKKSSRDPCLWRRRWCVLGEDRLWYMKLKHRRTQGRAAAISLVANHVVEHPRNSKVQYGIEMHTAHRVFLFRAADRAQQLGWIRAIQARIQLASENDLISVAELMICDEEQARARRMQHALEAAWAAGGKDEDGRGPAVALAMAVHEFRELCRMDLVSAEQKWEAARRVFDDFRLRDGSPQDAAREVERQLSEHAERLEARRREQSSPSAPEQAGGVAQKILPRFLGGVMGAVGGGHSGTAPVSTAAASGDGGRDLPPPPRTLFDALLVAGASSSASSTPPPPPP